MKKLVFFLLIVCLLILGGCATMQGMAEDFQNLGRGVKKLISEQRES